VKRPLTEGERRLAASVFGDAIDYERVELRRRRWWPFQPRNVAMAPSGHIHFHPRSLLWRDDFAAADLSLQALFVHEMTHVWQAQKGGRWYLPLARHPFCRYRYVLKPGRLFSSYGIEQQAEMASHLFLGRRGLAPSGAAPLEELEKLLPFSGG
jgi:hypothetical protein